ncbi:putative mannose-6-phosphate receptor binding domain superfamily, glucosidase II beta subunit [Plasmopara halstedii]
MSDWYKMQVFMKMTRSLLMFMLFELLITAFYATSSKHVRGVSPSEQNHYLHELTCAMEGRVTTLPFDRVNDEFCDCDDGQDEPGTAACSYLSSAQFYCENNGLLSEKIHTSRVHDGICDCCDGSDEEVAGKTLCPNSCMAVARTFQKKAELWLEVVKIGHEKRQTLVKGKVAEYFDSEEKLTSETQNELADLMFLKDRVTIHKDREELIERKYRINVARQKQAEGHEKEDMSQKVSDSNGEQEVEEVDFTGLDAIQVSSDYVFEKSAEDERAYEILDLRRETIKSLIELPDGTQISLADYFRIDHNDLVSTKRAPPRTIAEIRRDDFLGPLFNGGAEGRKRIGLYTLRTIGIVMSPLRAMIEIVFFCPRTLWHFLSRVKLLRPVVDVLRNLPYPSRSVWFRQLGGGSVYDGYNSLMWGAQIVWDAPIYAYNYLFPKLSDEFKLPVAESLRKALNEINAYVAKLENEQCKRRETAQMDYGPDRAFFALKDECIEKRIEKYTYKFCAFNEVKQDNTRLGKWGSWAVAEVTDSSSSEASDMVTYTKMQYSNGQKCYNGPDRSVVVNFLCGTDDEIVSVEEPSTCVYEMIVRSPLACSSHVLAKAEKDVTIWTQGR